MKVPSRTDFFHFKIFSIPDNGKWKLLGSLGRRSPSRWAVVSGDRETPTKSFPKSSKNSRALLKNPQGIDKFRKVGMVNGTRGKGF